MEPAADEDLPPLPWGNLKPYVTAVLLRCTNEDPEVSLGQLIRKIRQPSRASTTRSECIVAASDLVRAEEARLGDIGTLDSLDLDHIFGFIRRKQSPPGWLDGHIDIEDIQHELTLVLRCGDLVAVTTDVNTKERLQTWLDKAPLPQLQRIDSRTLEAAFLTGDAKNLWTRQVQRSSSLRPDAKATSGSNLGDTLDPVEDSAYAMSSARCEMPESEAPAFLKGTVGVTVGHSQLWFKAAPDLITYILTIAEILQYVDSSLQNELDTPDQFDRLAKRVTDIKTVSNAVELTVIGVESLVSAASPELQEAADKLQRAVLEVKEGTNTSRLFLDVGLDGTTGGTLAVNLKPVNNRFDLVVGFDPRCNNPLPAVSEVREALETCRDLVTIYYGSGHKYSDGQLWVQNFSNASFSGWDWRDFGTYDIKHEKPIGKKASQDIHNTIAVSGDKSLFAWVVANYSTGYLICDDGSGEAADFFHLDTDDLLSVIHVKAASSNAPRRRVRPTDYEVVTSQATKNLVYMDRALLAARLKSPRVARPACWTNGAITTDRSEFLKRLEASGGTARTEIVVVQPHMTARAYKRLRALDPASRTEDLLRLYLLDMMLNVARASVVKYGADLKVIGSI